MFLNTDFLRSDEIFLKLKRTCDANPEKQWVPAYYFAICLPDGTEIGTCDLRIGYNDKLHIGGHIGYRVEEPYRGHHYAGKACKLLFELARKHDMAYLYITCDPDNAPSDKTLRWLDGAFEGKYAIPEDNEMYAEGKRFVNIYRFDLN